MKKLIEKVKKNYIKIIIYKLFLLQVVLLFVSMSSSSIDIELPPVSFLEVKRDTNISNSLYDLEDYLIANYNYNLGINWLTKVYLLGEKYDVNPLFAIATAYIETGFVSSAVGKAGEIGLFQFLPHTASMYDNFFREDKLYNIDYATELYFKHMEDLLYSLNSNYYRSVLSYNAGRVSFLQKASSSELTNLIKELYHDRNWRVYPDEIMKVVFDLDNFMRYTE